jgi:glucan phosphoethanolaminetransferase (alkaline phosphatase superfamily)
VPTPEEKYYDAMNTLLAPVRWVKSLVQAALITVGVILAGLGLPFYCLYSGTHMSTGMWEFTGLTVMCLFCFFLAPWYTVVGGIICFVVFYALCFSQSFVDSLSGNGLLLFVFTFLSVGILQRYLRYQWNAHERKVAMRELAATIREVNGRYDNEERAERFNHMGSRRRDHNYEVHGDYANWPDSAFDNSPDEFFFDK